MLYQVRVGISSNLETQLCSLLGVSTPIDAFATLSADLRRAAGRFTLLAEFCKRPDVEVIRGIDPGVFLRFEGEVPEGLAPVLEEVPPNHVLTEDQMGTVRAHSSTAPVVGGSVHIRTMDASAMADAFAELEKRGFKVAAVLLNPDGYQDLRKYGRDALTLYSDVWILRQGIQGKIWGAVVMVSRDHLDHVGLLGYSETGGWMKMVFSRSPL